MAQLLDYGPQVLLVEVELTDLGVRLVEFLVFFPQEVYLLDLLLRLHHALAGLFDRLLGGVDVLDLVLYSGTGLSVEFGLSLLILPQDIVELFGIYVTLIRKDILDDSVGLFLDGCHVLEIDQHSDV